MYIKWKLALSNDLLSDVYRMKEQGTGVCEKGMCLTLQGKRGKIT